MRERGRERERETGRASRIFLCPFLSQSPLSHSFSISFLSLHLGYFLWLFSTQHCTQSCTAICQKAARLICSSRSRRHAPRRVGECTPTWQSAALPSLPHLLDPSQHFLCISNKIQLFSSICSGYERSVHNPPSVNVLCWCNSSVLFQPLLMVFGFPGMGRDS